MAPFHSARLYLIFLKARAPLCKTARDIRCSYNEKQELYFYVFLAKMTTIIYKKEQNERKPPCSLSYLIISLMISPAIIRPTTEGTKETLPGVLSPLGFIGGSSENTTLR